MDKDIRDFKLPSGEIIPLKLILFKKLKNVATSPISLGFIKFGNINVSELFYEKFNYPEQVVIIYHELWHKDNNLKHEFYMLKRNPFLLFYHKPILHSQEFNADLYAKQKTNKKDTLNMLNILKGLINDGILSQKHEESHPPIKERIKRIKRS